MKRLVLSLFMFLVILAFWTPVQAAPEETWVQTVSTGVYIPTYRPDETNPFPALYQGTWRGMFSQFLLRFDITNLPKNVVITSAKMELYCVKLLNVDATNYKTNKLVYERVTEPWNETNVTANTRPKSSASDTVYADFPLEAEHSYSVDVTSFVQGWYKGTFPNYGILGRSQTTPDMITLNAQFVASKSYLDREEPYRPKLIVTYTK